MIDPRFGIFNDASGEYRLRTHKHVQRSKKPNRVIQVKEEQQNLAGPEHSEVGVQTVGPIGIVLIMVYVILLSLLLLYGIVQLWPSITPTGDAAPTSSLVTFLFWTFSISDESRLILIVAMAGALGSLVHTLRSASWYIGNREFVRSWLAFYILLPFVGATLGLVFYLVIRGGFFSPQATVQQTSPFGFAALSGLVGMFSEQAVRKLKQVFETLLAEAQKGKNRTSQNNAREKS